MAVNLQTRDTLLLYTDKLVLHVRFEYSQVFYCCFHFLFNPMRSFVYKMDQNNIVAPATKRRRRSREAVGVPSDRPAQPSYHWEQSPGFSCHSALVLDHNYCCCFEKICQKKKIFLLLSSTPASSMHYTTFIVPININEHWFHTLTSVSAQTMSLKTVKVSLHQKLWFSAFTAPTSTVRVQLWEGPSGWGRRGLTSPTPQHRGISREESRMQSQSAYSVLKNISIPTTLAACGIASRLRRTANAPPLLPDDDATLPQAPCHALTPQVWGQC